ncbi:uncharacterized protein LOC113958970 [Corapipo altera]|uniref:uncharacterized protein LOC113958970 n=1 Tax=Corapipo altera TaxID=415028 RepID=UPI000FD637F7|nr:uncharacterized protein LOC113958970 [Corapipo altera]
MAKLIYSRNPGSHLVFGIKREFSPVILLAMKMDMTSPCRPPSHLFPSTAQALSFQSSTVSCILKQGWGLEHHLTWVSKGGFVFPAFGNGWKAWSAEILLSTVSGLLEPHLSLAFIPSPVMGSRVETRVNLTPSHSLIPQLHSKHFSECPATCSNSFPPPSPLLGCSGMRNVLLPSASDLKEPVHLGCFHRDCLQRKFSASCTTQGLRTRGVPTPCVMPWERVLSLFPEVPENWSHSSPHMCSLCTQGLEDSLWKGC